MFVDMKRRVITSFVLLVLALSSFVFVTYAWFTNMFEDAFTAEMGFVDVDITVYFDDGLGGQIPAEEIAIAPGVTKPGVYFVNVVSDENPSYFEDLRVYIDVKSNINTYFRVKIYEQLTLIYTDYQGEITELSILMDEYMPFNYELTNWYDNRTYDNYLYYQLPVQRVGEFTPLEIGLVTSYFSGQSFNTYSPGYSLQIAFSIEAVQSEGGPENVWGLPTPPWGGSW